MPAALDTDIAVSMIMVPEIFFTIESLSTHLAVGQRVKITLQ